MRGRNVAGIVHVEALAEIVHHVAGEAELRALGALHVLGKAQRDGEHRRDEQGDERQNLSAARPREFGAEGDKTASARATAMNSNSRSMESPSLVK